MLTQLDLATIRAALWYWEQEICPHGMEAAQPYFDKSELELLTAAEVSELRMKLGSASLRYLPCRPDFQIKDHAPLLESLDAMMQQVNPPDVIATVLIPARAA